MSNNAVSINDIKSYLKEVEFKKAVLGGCDKEDVLQKLHTVTLMFREVVAEQDERLTEALGEIERLKSHTDTRRESISGSLREMDSLRYRADAAREYEEKSQVLMEELVRKERERGEVMQRAENDARKIVLQAEEKARDILRGREWELDQTLAEKRRLLDRTAVELEQLKEERRSYIRDLKVTMRLINEEFNQIQSKAQTLIRKADGLGEEAPYSVPEILLK